LSSKAICGIKDKSIVPTTTTSTTTTTKRPITTAVQTPDYDKGLTSFSKVIFSNLKV
jgi:hypothetical protein